MDHILPFLLVGVLLVGGLLFAVIVLARGNKRALDTAKYQSAWLTIESNFKKDQPHSYMVACLEADKLLDQALKERGFAGQTMGDRMKSARKVWSKPNAVWSAHKLRNKFAHETGVKASYKEVAYALAAFKRALKDLGAV